MSPLSCSFFSSRLVPLLLCLLCLLVLFVILAWWPSALQHKMPALLFVCVLYDFVVL